MLNNVNDSVVRRWLSDCCTWKQQTVLLSALRGCDGRPKSDPSNVFKKKMRFTLLKNADESTSFMESNDVMLNEKTKKEINDFFTGCLDSYPMHYFLHFLHAAEICAYKNPNGIVAEYWKYFYLCGVEAMHLNPETQEQLDTRLSDLVPFKGNK